MKVTMQLTLDGLLRGLRSRAHAIADAAESGAPRAAKSAMMKRREALKRKIGRKRGGRHDRGNT